MKKTINKSNLIGISGKMGSGKDTVGVILQYLQYRKTFKVNTPITEKNFEIFRNSLAYKDQVWRVKKFADKLKDMVCLLIGCTREQLEDREFKEKELGEEWWYISKPDIGMFIPYTEDNWAAHGDFEENLIMLTPRKLLQLLGTECGRDIIHPNIWVNALFADYPKIVDMDDKGLDVYENWIITDVRFPNEAQAIKDRGGVVIRVNRLTEEQKIASLKSRANRPNDAVKSALKYEHPSETSLDNYEFDHVIDNNSDIPSLTEKVKQLNLV